ncbi:LCP family protein [Actinomycetospora lutea]|uniref:LCP family protein n=1 Tax=Actinomycetospora lutea TaxID=663604 RepID=UPI002366F5C4|nr:LCP family protein [Actinomycetospora lutea]MDD7937655.1 LCP family protein [Actinomycetospora lutea]
MSVGGMIDQDGRGPDPDEERGRRRRGVRALVYGLIALLVLVLLAAAGVVIVTQQLGSQVGRYPSVFAPIDPSSRPADSAGQTFLLIGTDSRSPEPTTGTEAAPDAVFGSQRSDVIMVATIAENGQSASVVSIPRDSYVDIPGRGQNKINAALAFGGPPLLIQTVEQLTAVHIDHYAVIDFAGFAQMTDAVGGIDVNVGQESERDGVVVPAGEQHLDGAQALVYVRERKSLPGGDLDRVRRQQAALRAFLEKALSSGTLSSPTGAYALVDTVSRHVGVDDSLSNTGLAQLAISMRDLRNSNVSFLTVPVSGTGTEGDQSVVYLNRTAGRDLWFAVNTDAVPQYVATRPQEQLSDTPR